MMRTVLLVSAFAISLVNAGDPNVTLVSDYFAKKDPPLVVIIDNLEQRIGLNDFSVKFRALCQELITEVTVELFRQAKLQTDVFRNSFVSVRDELSHHLRSVEEEKEGHSLDDVLKKLNDRLQKYLNLRPGNIKLEDKVKPTYSKIPALRKGSRSSFYTYQPMDQLFLNLGEIVDKHLSSIHFIIDALYVRGWRNARDSFDELQKNLRSAYLNGYLLHTINDVVNNVFENGKDIQKCVSATTWQEFVVRGTSVRELYYKLKPLPDVELNDSKSYNFWY